MLTKFVLMAVVGVMTLSVLTMALVARTGSSSIRISGHKLTRPSRLDLRMMATVGATEIKVIKAGEVSDKDVNTMKTWPVWGCEPSKFPWSYGEKETALVIKGKAVVTPNDPSLAVVTIEKGDVAVFPAGMSCTWDVQEEISKHYRFG
jgi:uncharacterized cupin superfamily protein